MATRLPAASAPLTPLAQRLGPFHGFGSDRGKIEQMVDELRSLARERQSHDPTPFYAVRTIASHFGVSLWAAGAVLKSLESEGLVVRLRGSRTVVPSRAGIARQPPPLHGRVAVVTWLPGFLYVRDIRDAIMRLEYRLMDRGFACDLVCYHEEDKRRPDLAQRILAHHPGFAIWLTPGPADESTMHSLADAGVRVAALSDQAVRISPPQYVLDWRRGLRRAMREWAQQGVGRVLVATPRMKAPWKDLDAALQGCELESATVAFQGEPIEEFITGLARRPGGIVFYFDMWEARVCTQVPRAFARLLTRRRVLSLHSLPIERSILGDARIDILEMPWARIVDRLTNDIATGAILSMSHDEVFHATYRSRVPAARYAKAYAFENV